MDRCDLRALLCQVHESLTAAIACVRADPEAATDDMVAARLLVTTALFSMRDDE